MSAQVQFAFYAWCADCADGSDVGISSYEAEAWAAEHDQDNHEDDK
jgi:hypothetical protein